MDNQSDLQTFGLETTGLSIVDEATGDESTRSSNSPHWKQRPTSLVHLSEAGRLGRTLAWLPSYIYRKHELITRTSYKVYRMLRASVYKVKVVKS
jgi:hypothetical protein